MIGSENNLVQLQFIFETVMPHRETQRDQILKALQEPMTINQLYRKLPHISPENIAPLVRYLNLDERVFAIGKKADLTLKGLLRNQVIWSSRPEHKPCNDAMSIMNRIFGAHVDVNKLPVTGYVVQHLCDDANQGIKTKIK